MTTAPRLTYDVTYQGTEGCARWEGRNVGNDDGFRTFLRGPVRDRVHDAEAEEPFAAELRALATTGMAPDFLEEFLRAVPEPQDWEIGEALAECVLAQEAAWQVCWPWNTVRDRRTPRASLPGADLVGFCRIDGGALLLFGEVKTSSDTGAPPNVMYGGSGMTWQLEENAIRLEIQHALLRWLRARCGSPEHVDLYRAAVARYLASQGREILLVGILLRDTLPDERDVRSRARALAATLAPPTRIEIFTWYLPIPIAQWPAVLDGGTS
jgi:hypothetical protein